MLLFESAALSHLRTNNLSNILAYNLTIKALYRKFYKRTKQVVVFGRSMSVSVFNINVIFKSKELLQCYLTDFLYFSSLFVFLSVFVFLWLTAYYSVIVPLYCYSLSLFANYYAPIEVQKRMLDPFSCCIRLTHLNQHFKLFVQHFSLNWTMDIPIIF